MQYLTEDDVLAFYREVIGKLFLQIHGYTMHATDAEGPDLFMNRITTGMTVEELATWIERHISPLPIDEDEDDAE